MSFKSAEMMGAVNFKAPAPGKDIYSLAIKNANMQQEASVGTQTLAPEAPATEPRFMGTGVNATEFQRLVTQPGAGLDHNAETHPVNDFGETSPGQKQAEQGMNEFINGEDSPVAKLDQDFNPEESATLDQPVAETAPAQPTTQPTAEANPMATSALEATAPAEPAAAPEQPAPEAAAPDQQTELKPATARLTADQLGLTEAQMQDKDLVAARGSSYDQRITQSDPRFRSMDAIHGEAQKEYNEVQQQEADALVAGLKEVIKANADIGEIIDVDALVGKDAAKITESLKQMGIHEEVKAIADAQMELKKVQEEAKAKVEEAKANLKKKILGEEGNQAVAQAEGEVADAEADQATAEQQVKANEKQLIDKMMEKDDEGMPWQQKLVIIQIVLMMLKQSGDVIDKGGGVIFGEQ